MRLVVSGHWRLTFVSSIVKMCRRVQKEERKEKWGGEGKETACDRVFELQGEQESRSQELKGVV